MPYDHKQIEQKWRQKWQDSKTFETHESSDKPKFYALDMFPYPSGAGLHVGHPKGYIATDIISRMKMMQGFNVLHPMGWDAFGLPAENFAIKNKVHPAVATAQNVETFKKQLSILGFTYDWEREVNTTDPKYYKWTQWAFLQMFKKGLAFESNEPVNWCPTCKTVLANEDLEGGNCERCGSAIEHRPLRQWVLRITDYAERLLNDLDKLPNWPESIKLMQKEWIGRSEGATVRFHLSPNPSPGERGDAVVGRITTDSVTWNLLRDKALEMKKNSTKAEAAMWEIVRRNATGAHFRRQQIIGGFIVDFVCLKKKLIIEVDGDIHDSQEEKDEARTEYLNELGFEVVRFKNDDVLNETDRVTKEISEKVASIADTSFLPPGEDQGGVIEVFTTRPDTLFGATYMVLAPEHPLVSQITTDEHRAEVEDYIAAAKSKSEIERGDDTKEKTGVFTGAYAINPVNDEEIPIWVADYVLWGYGTGAIMAVPAHDTRDWDFATRYQIKKNPVVEPESFEKFDFCADVYPQFERHNLDNETPKETTQRMIKEEYELVKNGERCYVGVGKNKNSDFLNGLSTSEAKNKMISWLEEKGLGARKIQYKLRDWVFSRQRYWGEPIPLVHCEGCKEKIETSTIKLSFWDQTDWRRLVTGRKTIETRALNPEEPERYFGNVGVGQFLCVVNKVTNEEKYFRVTKVWLFKNLEELFGHPELLHPIAPDDFSPTLEDWKKGYSKNAPDYLERIEKNGLIAWQVELVTPGIVPVPESELPLELPPVEHYEPTDTGESPLANITDWVNTTCPECGGPARRETNTMPQWAGSCWYYLRYCDPKNSENFFGQGLVQRPAIAASENDRVYFSEFKKIYSELEGKGIKVWTGNRFLLNGLNRELWLPLRTVCLVAWEKNTKAISDHLETLGYKQTQENAGNLLFEKNEVRVEIVPVYEKDREIFSLSYQNAKQPMKITDLPESPLGFLWNFAFRTVSPSYNLAHYKYIQENEAESRQGLGDQDKIDFLTEWLEKNNLKLAYWNPVDLYVGGAEHATRHLIYARFWHKFLFDIGAVHYEEPFMRLQNVGLIMAEDGRKMSKRWGNVVNPDDVVEEYGADALRVYEMFMGPFNQPAAWSTNGLVGTRRFLEKVSGLVSIISETESEKVTRALHQTIKKVSDDVVDFRFNTAVAQMMTFVNLVQEEKGITKDSFLEFLQVLCPFAPHLTNELAEQLGETEILETKPWPGFDPALLVADKVTIAVQVNGKLRGTLEVLPEAEESEVQSLALNEENVKKFVEGKEIRKVIFVKGKLLNIVAS